MTLKYSELSSRRQIQFIREKAILAAKKFGLRIDEIRCVNHGYNTTFKIKSGSNSYAVRLGVSTTRTNQNINAEHEWLNSLFQSGANVPELKRLKNSRDTLLVLPKDDVFQSIPVTVMHWVPGSILGNRRASTIIKQLEKVGRQTAIFHENSKDLKFSKNAKLEVLSGVLWNRPNRIKDFQKNFPKLVNKKRLTFFTSLLKHVQDFDNSFKKNKSMIPIHADLHVWNINTDKDNIYILDFDDCGLALPVWDMAVTLYYHANESNFNDYLASYMKGYSSIRQLPFSDMNTLKIYMLGRGLTLINDVVTWENSKIAEELPEIFDRVEARLKKIKNLELKG